MCTYSRIIFFGLILLGFINGGSHNKPNMSISQTNDKPNNLLAGSHSQLQLQHVFDYRMVIQTIRLVATSLSLNKEWLAVESVVIEIFKLTIFSGCSLVKNNTKFKVMSKIIVILKRHYKRGWFQPNREDVCRVEVLTEIKRVLRKDLEIREEDYDSKTEFDEFAGHIVVKASKFPIWSRYTFKQSIRDSPIQTMYNTLRLLFANTIGGFSGLLGYNASSLCINQSRNFSGMGLMNDLVVGGPLGQVQLFAIDAYHQYMAPYRSGHRSFVSLMWSIGCMEYVRDYFETAIKKVKKILKYGYYVIQLRLKVFTKYSFWNKHEGVPSEFKTYTKEFFEKNATICITRLWQINNVSPRDALRGKVNALEGSKAPEAVLSRTNAGPMKFTSYWFAIFKKYTPLIFFDQDDVIESLREGKLLQNPNNIIFDGTSSLESVTALCLVVRFCIFNKDMNSDCPKFFTRLVTSERINHCCHECTTLFKESVGLLDLSTSLMNIMKPGILKIVSRMLILIMTILYSDLDNLTQNKTLITSGQRALQSKVMGQHQWVTMKSASPDKIIRFPEMKKEIENITRGCQQFGFGLAIVKSFKNWDVFTSPGATQDDSPDVGPYWDQMVKERKTGIQKISAGIKSLYSGSKKILATVMKNWEIREMHAGGLPKCSSIRGDKLEPGNRSNCIDDISAKRHAELMPVYQIIGLLVGGCAPGEMLIELDTTKVIECVQEDLLTLKREPQIDDDLQPLFLALNRRDLEYAILEKWLKSKEPLDHYNEKVEEIGNGDLDEILIQLKNILEKQAFVGPGAKIDTIIAMIIDDKAKHDQFLSDFEKLMDSPFDSNILIKEIVKSLADDLVEKNRPMNYSIINNRDPFEDDRELGTEASPIDEPVVPHKKVPEGLEQLIRQMKSQMENLPGEGDNGGKSQPSINGDGSGDETFDTSLPQKSSHDLFSEENAGDSADNVPKTPEKTDPQAGTSSSESTGSFLTLKSESTGSAQLNNGDKSPRLGSSESNKTPPGSGSQTGGSTADNKGKLNSTTKSDKPIDVIGKDKDDEDSETKVSAKLSPKTKPVKSGEKGEVEYHSEIIIQTSLGTEMLLVVSTDEETYPAFERVFHLFSTLEKNMTLKNHKTAKLCMEIPIKFTQQFKMRSDQEKNTFSKADLLEFAEEWKLSQLQNEIEKTYDESLEVRYDDALRLIEANKTICIEGKLQHNPTRALNDIEAVAKLLASIASRSSSIPYSDYKRAYDYLLSFLTALHPSERSKGYFHNLLKNLTHGELLASQNQHKENPAENGIFTNMGFFIRGNIFRRSIKLDQSAIKGVMSTTLENTLARLNLNKKNVNFTNMLFALGLSIGSIVQETGTGATMFLRMLEKSYFDVETDEKHNETKGFYSKHCKHAIDQLNNWSANPYDTEEELLFCATIKLLGIIEISTNNYTAYYPAVKYKPAILYVHRIIYTFKLLRGTTKLTDFLHFTSNLELRKRNAANIIMRKLLDVAGIFEKSKQKLTLEISKRKFGSKLTGKIGAYEIYVIFAFGHLTEIENYFQLLLNNLERAPESQQKAIKRVQTDILRFKQLYAQIPTHEDTNIYVKSGWHPEGKKEKGKEEVEEEDTVSELPFHQYLKTWEPHIGQRMAIGNDVIATNKFLSDLLTGAVETELLTSHEKYSRVQQTISSMPQDDQAQKNFVGFFDSLCNLFDYDERKSFFKFILYNSHIGYSEPLWKLIYGLKQQEKQLMLAGRMSTFYMSWMRTSTTQNLIQGDQLSRASLIDLEEQIRRHYKHYMFDLGLMHPQKFAELWDDRERELLLDQGFRSMIMCVKDYAHAKKQRKLYSYQQKTGEVIDITLQTDIDQVCADDDDCKQVLNSMKGSLVDIDHEEGNKKPKLSVEIKHIYLPIKQDNNHEEGSTTSIKIFDKYSILVFPRYTWKTFVEDIKPPGKIYCSHMPSYEELLKKLELDTRNCNENPSLTKKEIRKGEEIDEDEEDEDRSTLADKIEESKFKCRSNLREASAFLAAFSRTGHDSVFNPLTYVYLNKELGIPRITNTILKSILYYMQVQYDAEDRDLEEHVNQTKKAKASDFTVSNRASIEPVVVVTGDPGTTPTVANDEIKATNEEWIVLMNSILSSALQNNYYIYRGEPVYHTFVKIDEDFDDTNKQLLTFLKVNLEAGNPFSVIKDINTLAVENAKTLLLGLIDKENLPRSLTEGELALHLNPIYKFKTGRAVLSVLAHGYAKFIENKSMKEIEMVHKLIRIVLLIENAFFDYFTRLEDRSEIRSEIKELLTYGHCITSYPVDHYVGIDIFEVQKKIVAENNMTVDSLWDIRRLVCELGLKSINGYLDSPDETIEKLIVEDVLKKVNDFDSGSFSPVFLTPLLSPYEMQPIFIIRLWGTAVTKDKKFTLMKTKKAFKEKAYQLEKIRENIRVQGPITLAKDQMKKLIKRVGAKKK